MRIALLTELYAPSLGGQELFFEGLGRALVDRGHKVEVLCIGHAEGSPATEVVDGITIRRHPQDPTYKTPPRAWMKRAWPSIFRYALWTRRVARTEDYDLLILNQWPLLHAATLPRSARQRAVLHWCEIRGGRFYGTLQKWLPRFAAYNAAISQAVATAIGGASGRPFFLLPSGLRLEEYRSTPRSARSGILSLGRVAEHKNLPLLLATFEQLKQRGFEGKLTIAGDGPVMEDLRKAVAGSPVGHDVEILGPVTDLEKCRLLADSALFMITSRREGFPRVVAEAMASGLPVVTTDYPGNGTKDVVRATDCGLVADPEPSALAEAAETALQRWNRYSDNGLAYAQSLDWATMAQDLEQKVSDLPRAKSAR